MRISLTKKEVEKLFDEKKYDELKELLMFSFSMDGAQAIINFFDANINKNTYSMAEMKNYMVNQVVTGIRNHNNEDDLKNFYPYIQKRKIFMKKISEKLTKEEEIHLKRFKKSIHLCRKKYNGNITQKTYNLLKRIYDYDKDTFYTGIHSTGSDIDEIFENGLCFDQIADFQNHVLIEHNFDEMLYNISSSEGYKQSRGCFIVKVPKRAINEKDEPIFYKNNDKIYLNPKYIVMFVPVVKKKILTPELNEEMSLVNSTLCEGDTLIKPKRMF